MGSCYSRKTAGAGLSSGDKAHKQKHIRSKSNNKQGTKELPPEKVPLTEGIEDIQDKQPVNALTSNTSHSSGTELVLEYLNLKPADHCVAPSDSGIESIQTLSEDAQDTVLATSERDELVKRLEHLDFDCCQKCGCLKLNSGSLLPVLKDSGGIHDSGLAKKFLSKPHGSNYYIEGKGNSSYTDSTKCASGRALATTNKEVSALNSSSNAEDSSHVDTISETQSDLEKSNSINKDAYNVSSSSKSSSVIWSKYMNKDIIYNLLVEGQCNAKASLPHRDGVDRCQNGSPSKKLSKQQNLLTSILNHTDSICKCDLHSSEYDLARDHEINDAVLKQGQFGEFSSKAPKHTSEQLKRKDESLKYSNSGVETSSHQTEVSIFHSCTAQDKSSTSISSSEHKHFHSSKIASVSARGETKSEAFIKPASSSTTEPIPASEETCANHHDSSVVDSSSGAYIQKTTLELLSLSGHRGACKRSSLVSAGAVMGDSGSDTLQCGTEDDLSSLDLDSIGRFNSQSISSMRNLVESTEELLSTHDSTAMYTSIDGVECVIIPTEMYHQMQTELSDLKEQLLCLSSLIQETEDEEQTSDSVVITSQP